MGDASEQEELLKDGLCRHEEGQNAVHKLKCSHFTCAGAKFEAYPASAKGIGNYLNRVMLYWLFDQVRG